MKKDPSPKKVDSSRRQWWTEYRKKAEEQSLVEMPMLIAWQVDNNNVRDIIVNWVAAELEEYSLDSVRGGYLRERCDEFIASLAIAADATKDESTRVRGIAHAIANAFFVGLECRSPALRARQRKERAAPANEARRAKTVQEIIDAEAMAYWERKPSNRRKASETARAIYAKVKLKLGKLSDVPKEWRSGDADNDRALIERIRKRISRATPLDE